MTVPASEQRAGRGHWRLTGVVAAAVSLIMGIIVLVLSQGIEEPQIASFSPRWWPEALGSLLIVLSLLIAAETWLRPPGSGEEQESSTRRGAARIALIFLLIAVYGVLWYFIDFRVSTFLLFTGLVAINGGRGWKAFLLFPAITTAVLYLFFDLLLKVPL